MMDSDLRQYFDNIEFPVTRERLIGRLMGRNAPGSVVETLTRMPSGCYENVDSVIHSLDGVQG
ncbi:MAG: DUF2795 domain-containing protein [Chloroflexota bacterium]